MTTPSLPDTRAPAGTALRTRGARLLQLPCVASAAGSLLWAEHAAHLPFAPQRFFCIFGVPPGEVRGRHAHRHLEEVLICLRGRVTVTLDDGDRREDIELADPQRALYIPPLTWCTQRYSADALLAVLASQVYGPDDYIRDYDAFRALRARQV
jgi:hypothetical protein